MASVEAVVAVAIAVLAAVFVGSLAALIVVCRQRYCRPNKNDDTSPDINLISNAELETELELDDVKLLDTRLLDLGHWNWVEDASGLIPHCLAILRTCHLLSERLVALAMGPGSNLGTSSQKQLAEVADLARRIVPRIDDFVHSMYPPLDPRLLEARAMALILSITHLALVTRQLQIGSAGWVDPMLKEMEHHQQILRQSAASFEMTCRNSTSEMSPQSILGSSEQ